MGVGLLDFFFPKYCVNCRKIGTYLCDSCFAYISFDVELICVVCNRNAIGGLTHPNCKGKYTLDGAFASIVYKGVVRKLLYNFKYKPYLSDLNDLLVDFFHEGLIQQEMFQQALSVNSIFAPIPLHPSRLKTRGYNHAQLLSDGLAKKFGIPSVELLKRTKQTKSQYGLKLKERKENLKDAFALPANALHRQVQAGLTLLHSGASVIPAKAGIGVNFSENPKILDPANSAGRRVEDDSNYTVFLVDDILTSGSTFSEAARVLKKSEVKKVYGIALARD